MNVVNEKKQLFSWKLHFPGGLIDIRETDMDAEQVRKFMQSAKVVIVNSSSKDSIVDFGKVHLAEVENVKD
jgi:hypothetical protein